MKNQYQWNRLFRRAQDAILSGECDPTFAALSKVLGLPTTTLQSGFLREFNLSGKDLAAPQSWVQPSETPSEQREYSGLIPAEIKKHLEAKPRTLAELASLLDRGPATVEEALDQMIADGFDFTKGEKAVTLQPKLSKPVTALWDEPKTSIRFAIASDTHWGSHHSQITSYQRFEQIAMEEYGIEHLLHIGDVFAGIGVYRGQHNELYAHSAEAQLEAGNIAMPVRKGLKRYLLEGNHDSSFRSANGFNIVKHFCEPREDLIYLGPDTAELPLVALEDQVIASALLWHPSGGVPYAYSYRGQKMAAEVAREELYSLITNKKVAPNIRFIFWGHLHISDFFPHGPIWVMGPGCFEGQTSYLRRKGLYPTIQGLIVEADLTELGLISRMNITPIPFLEVEDDYLNWLPESELPPAVEPLFSYA